jgi:V8-like Glu-specific endopeptidase
MPLTTGEIVSAAGETGTLARLVVEVPGARWLRLRFGEVRLAGDPAADGSVIRLTSATDGEVQELDAQDLRRWGGTSAYFNGPRVEIELRARGAAGENQVQLVDAVVGEPAGPGGAYGERSICGVDDRRPCDDRAVARYLPSGCTAWLFEDANHTMLTAGHCSVAVGGVTEFNVPLSSPDGTIVHPSPRDQYPVEATSVQMAYSGLGNDWTYFGCYPNSQTGLTAYQAQRAAFVLAPEAPAADGRWVTITGYGVVDAPMPRAWNQSLKAGAGEYGGVEGTTIRYTADTTGGNSGSPVVLWDDWTVIGIHTNAGCTASDGWNGGTAVQTPGLQRALAHPRGICRSGVAPRTGSVFAIGDANNNFGVVNEWTGEFALVSQSPPGMQGLAYDLATDRVYAVDSARSLSVIDPSSGVMTRLGTVTGGSAVLTGLGYDPEHRTLWAISQADGQLGTIDVDTLAFLPVGAPGGGAVGGLEFDPFTKVLYGLDDAPGGAGGTRLVRFDTATGVRTIVGALGAGIVDCNGLAINADGRLYTIDSGTGMLLRINASTGAAEVVGPTGGLFGASMGMTARLREPCPDPDFNQDGNTDQDDVAALVQAIASGTWDRDPDINQDGNVDADDIAALIQVLAGGSGGSGSGC